MSAAALQTMYAEAQRLFQEGRLQQCRETVEDLLLALSQVDERGSTASRPPGAADAPLQHLLFSSGLLLLSGCYSAVASFDEAERLLATCQGYLEENGASFGSAASANQALAAVAYSRGVIRLEMYRTQDDTPIDVVREADTVFLPEAERRLIDVLGAERLLLADVWHSRGVCCEILAAAEGGGDGTDAKGGQGGAGPQLPRSLRALEHYARSMDIRTRYQGTDGVTELKLALTMEHVAHLLRLSATPAEPSRKDEALSLLGTVAETRRRLLGPRHPLVASTLLAEGALCAELGRYKRAKKAFTAALSIVTAVYSADDVRVAEVEYGLSRVS